MKPSSSGDTEGQRARFPGRCLLAYGGPEKYSITKAASFYVILPLQTDFDVQFHWLLLFDSRAMPCTEGFILILKGLGFLKALRRWAIAAFALSHADLKHLFLLLYLPSSTDLQKKAVCKLLFDRQASLGAYKADLRKLP